MSPSALKIRAKRLITESLAPYLKTLGFKKRGDVFLRGSERLLELIDVQHSRWNDQDEVSFTLNCGIWMRGVTSTFRNMQEPKLPKLTDCCISARVGMLTNSHLDVWWKLETAAPPGHDDDVGAQITASIERAVLPFLKRFESEEAVARFLSEAPTGSDELVDPRAEAVRAAYAAAAWTILGDPKRCRACLDRALSASKGTPLDEVVKGFANRMTC